MADEIQPEPQKSSFFSGPNKILVLLGAFFGIFIVIQLTYMVYQGAPIPGLPQKKQALLPTLTPFPVPSTPAAANLEFYRTLRNNKPATEGQIVISEYKGKLTTKETSLDTLTLSVENEEQVVNDLHYARTVSIDSTGLSLDTINVGDMVIITETSDISKSFPNNVQKIKIVTFTVK